MKRIFSKKQLKWIKRNMRPENGIMPTLMIAFFMIAAFGHKQEIKADAGRGAFWGGLSGAAIGGAAGGGKGAAIGAGVGLGLGAIMGAASDSDSGRSNDPYRKLDKLQNKLDNLENKAASTSSDKRRARYERQISATQNQIARMKENLGIRQQPALGIRQQPAHGYYSQDK